MTGQFFCRLQYEKQMIKDTEIFFHRHNLRLCKTALQAVLSGNRQNDLQNRFTADYAGGQHIRKDCPGTRYEQKIIYI
ncbi:MAG: hypothetical protein BWK80_30725 [Desulfobacteraceae bacterium IS3]|nr:MAG: hypothetical protein BWK80_30725 [Desulfobacteraceae bacterium IS3]